MLVSLWPLTAAACFLIGDGSPFGYLGAKSAAAETSRIPYEPRAGDLVFYDDHSRMWTVLFAWAGTGPPLHMGIVVRNADGSFAVLEAGPDDTIWVRLADLGPRLAQFQKRTRGTISIRRCKKELTPQQSLALTRFALRQDGKLYAVQRLLLQGSAFRARGPLEPLLGKTYLEQRTWICSELAVAAGTVAGLFDPSVVHANATYPRDVFDNRRHNLGETWHDAARWIE